MRRQAVTATVVTLLTLVASSPVFAQGVYLGARAGITRTNTSLEIQGVKPANVDALTGGGGGILAGYRLTPSVALQLEVLFSSEGFKTGGTPIAVPLQNDTVSVFEWNLNYVSVPFVVVARLPATSVVKLRLTSGVSFDFETSCKVKIVGTGSGDGVNCEDNPATRTKSVAFGIPLGAGVDFGLGPGQRTNLFLDVGYKIGVTNRSNTGANAIRLRDNLFSVTVGVAFLLGQ